ncbi:hypothetical protein BGZ95_006406 [Linnemannia exigua]|uniref:Uncharacterized protein n=1 Tax=Linnemannia exigua TaxID=604196 RepID=A0AAD4D1B4_9FUNG|nr:hypothetical protein BGZ95_006406 [Linnemannia exigua]
MTLSEVMAAKQASIPDSAATLEQSKLLQQQIELQQGQQRVDERLALLMVQNHNYQPLQEAVNLDPKPTSESIRATCPFLELNKDNDDMNSDEPMVTLKGYTETEEGWKALQWALEKFLDDPIQDHNSALPPDDTLIPSYHSPPEIRLSEKANMFLSAKASMIEEANLAASMAAVDAVRSPTPDISMSRHDSGLPSTTIPYSNNSSAAMSASSSSATTATSATTMANGTSSSSSNGPVAQIRATSVSLTRWMNLSGGGGDRDKNKKGAAAHRASSSVSAASFHAVTALPPVPDQQHTNNNKQAYNIVHDVPSSHTSSSLNNNSNKAGSAAATAGGSSKRGITPANVLSLSVGSGTSLFRPRPRLNQQRSADELSKTLQLGHSRTVSGSGSGPNGLFQVYENDLSGHYTTSAAMMYPIDHITEELRTSTTTGRSTLEHVTTVSAAAAVTANASDAACSTLVLSPPSLSSSSSSPPSSTSSSSASLSYKSSQAMIKSTGEGGGVGGALYETQEGSEKVVYHVQESDHRSSVEGDHGPPPAKAAAAIASTTCSYRDANQSQGSDVSQ